jgi:hypothetical protein
MVSEGSRRMPAAVDREGDSSERAGRACLFQGQRPNARCRVTGPDYVAWSPRSRGSLSFGLAIQYTASIPA